MKKCKSIYICLLFVSLLAGCDFLDKQPDDQLTMDMIWSDRVRTEDWLAGVYSSIPNPLWGYMKDQGYNIMGDDITIPQDWSPYGWANVYAFTVASWNPSSAWNPNYWIELPKRIRAGYQFLENVRIIPEVDLKEDYVNQMKAEVRFLIAYYYSLLLETYGTVPFVQGAYDVDVPTAELMLTQTPHDEIVDWIDQELWDVSQQLPAIYPNNTDWGRITSIMALAIRAKTLLFSASPLFNGNEDFKDWKNADGVNLFDANYSVEKWQRAADAFKDLITAAEAAGYGLYYAYNSDGSIDPFMSYYNLSLMRFSEGNKEIIFGFPNAIDLGNWQAHHLPKGIGGNAAMGVTQELVDAFFMEDGTRPILGYNEDGSPKLNPECKLYSENGFSTENEMRKTRWTGGGPSSLVDGDMSPVTMVGTFNMYCHREPRFYISVIFNKAWLGVENRQVGFLQGQQDTDMTFDSPQNGYNVRKAVPLDAFPEQGRAPYQPGILYRMADAYLGYAEALNEVLDVPNAEVYKYVNMIRERAGIPDLKEGLSKEEMREAIQQERRVEFNCEGIRIEDLRRWKLAEKYLNVRLYGMNHDGSEESDDVNNPQAFYKRTFYKERFYDKRMNVWPVPQAQIDINPNLVQAPGY